MKSKHILQQVKKTYSSIADEFDITRNRSWPEFEVFLKYLFTHYSLPITRYSLLDIGCGNGRLWHFLSPRQAHGDIGPIDYVGVDNNRKMLSIAKKKNPKAHFRYADACKLPFPAHSFDTVWAIAVLHHLPIKKLQLQALKEMKRVLKPDGLLFLTVWNLWQKKYKKYIDEKTHHAKIPWGTGKKVKRYYYAFHDPEIRNLLKKSGFNSVKKISSLYNLTYICS